MLKGTLSMEIIERLAHEILTPQVTEGNEELLSQLGEECELRLSTAEGEARVLLRYFQARIPMAAIIESKSKDANYSPGVGNYLTMLRISSCFGERLATRLFETADPKNVLRLSEFEQISQTV